MTNEQVFDVICNRMSEFPLDISLYEDAFSCVRSIGENNMSNAQKKVKALMGRMGKSMTVAMEMNQLSFMSKQYDLCRRCLFFAAPYDFDSFLRAIEYDAPPNKQFYKPRRSILKPMVEGYQEILDENLRLLTVSMPKRSGKTQTELLFCLMLAGKHPDGAILMEGTGDGLVKSFYKGILEYLETPNPYHFYEIYPDSPLVQTNAETLILNLKSKSRFPSIMCRSIDARQVGLSEANRLLVLDDCVEGREEAKNRQRLDDKWEVISGDVMGRAIEGTPIVATGTRYSLYDPIGHLQEEAQKQGWKWKAIEIPALDPVTDESNYEYEREGKRVFTTAFFREQRELLSAEQFESEFQQQPFEAKGLLFPEKELNTYFKLPVDRDADAIISVCDTAESGSDSTALVVAKIYGSEVYIDDVVFDNSPSDVTKPQCAKCLIDNKVSTAVFESNNAGTYYARDVDTLVSQRGYNVSIRTKRTISNKQTRIEFASDGIKKHFFFKHSSTYERGSQYWAFMKEVVTYTRSGKVPHDDAPDVLSLLENEIRGLIGSKVEIFKRPV